MATLYRSSTMDYYQIIVARESAWEFLSELGNLNTLHIVEDNQESQINRSFTNYIKRCDELQKKMDMIKLELIKWNFTIEQPSNIDELLYNFKLQIQSRQKAGQTYLDEIEQEIQFTYHKIQDQLKSYESLQERANTLLEYDQVLKISKAFFGNNFLNLNNNDQQKGDNEYMSYDCTKVNYIMGTINRVDSDRFRRMIFRVSKGNAMINFKTIDVEDLSNKYKDSKISKQIEKDVFLMFYPGGQMDMLKYKLLRFCDSFNCQRFQIPENQQLFAKKGIEISQQYHETYELQQSTMFTLKQSMQNLVDRKKNNCSYIEELSLYVLREKSIYQCMNMLKIRNNIFIGHAWVPDYMKDKLYQSIFEINSKFPNLPGGQVTQMTENKDNPPTCILSNEFTYVFQEIVNTYGIPKYKEINPCIFLIITFPFQFGVMFGDIAHGLILFLFGLFLLFQNGNQKSYFVGFYPFRYIVTLMGFFALFAGTMYNDFLSLSFNTFGSCYDPNILDQYQPGVDNKNSGKVDHSYPYKQDCTYPYGMDPIWVKAGNELVFINSFKMKFAVILGVIQMIVGIILKGLNSLYFRKFLDFIFEFIPQIIFMCVTFGYMDLMIFYKWTVNYLVIPEGSTTPLTDQAPSIITLLINMPLLRGGTGGKNLYPSPPTPENMNNNYQESVQTTLLSIAILCVPLMLIPKPLLLIRQLRSQKIVGDQIQNEGDLSNDSIVMENPTPTKILVGHHHQQHKDDGMVGEIWVHQIIETIEFVLGSISNTASYLRLWALSLAHSQLSKVFFEQIIRRTFMWESITTGSIMMIFTFTIFCCISFGVLMIMDSMECFLHTLRLHWVEFQNKFFVAGGYLYHPFSFRDNIKKHYQQ